MKVFTIIFNITPMLCSLRIYLYFVNKIRHIFVNISVGIRKIYIVISLKLT